MKKFLHIVSDVDAQEVAELAIVVPILFTLIFGIFSFARAYNIYSTVTRAAQDGARIATASLCVSCGDATIPASCSATTPAGQYPPNSCVAQAVKDAVTASHLDSAQISELVPTGLADCPPPAPAHACTSQPLPSTTSKISICRNVVLNTNANSALLTCGTIVSFQYSYQFWRVPFLTINSLNIPARAQSRVEN